MALAAPYLTALSEHSSLRFAVLCLGIIDHVLLAPFIDDAIVLLRHKFLRCVERAFGAAQHGHRGRLLTRAITSRRRMVAIEFGTCRSGRGGGAPGPVTGGNGKLREQPSGLNLTFGARA